MKWIQHHLLWLVLNLLALAVMSVLLWYCFVGENVFRRYYSFTVVTSGRWAIRYLLICLMMTPLNTLFGWRYAIKLRKSAGLWAFAFAALHFSIYLSKVKLFWFDRPIPGIPTALGLFSLCIMTMLALTSMRDSMRWLGKWWKPLHRLVYAAGVLAIIHAMLEAPNTRVKDYDPDVFIEAVVYLAVLCVLLAVRIPLVRSYLAGWRDKARVAH